MSKQDKVLNKNTFLEHLSEFRKRLVIVAAVNVIAMVICFQFADILITYTVSVNPGMNLVYVNPSEAFMVLMKTSIILAVVIASPVTIYQIWAFVAKGLYKSEKVWMIVALIIGVIFFAGGVVFAYYVVLPITLNFFMRMELKMATSMISFDSYISFINTFLFAFGLVFEMPVLLVILAKFKLLSYKTLMKQQGIIIVGIFVIAAIITPPDVVSQLLLAVPMVGLLQLSIGACFFIEKCTLRKKKKTKKFKGQLNHS